MSLGVRGDGWRCVAVWLAATAVAGAGSLWSGRLARPTWAAARAGAIGSLPLDRALTGVAATALLGCAGWAWVASTAVVLEARRGQESSTTARSVPHLLRRAILAACGVALAGGLATPVSAAGAQHVHRTLAGLPLPDRATAPPRPRPEADLGRSRAHGRGRTVVVKPGDSLWSIAAATLPPRTSDARITAGWRAVYAENRALIGPDPDVLEPGQRLRLPGRDAS